MISTKLMIVGALAVSVSACVVHPRGGYSGSPGNSAYGHAQGNGPKGYTKEYRHQGQGHGNSRAGVRGRGSKVEVYGEVDAGVGYTRTKISR